MLESLRREQVTPERLVLRSNGVFSTLWLTGLAAVFVVAALPKIAHSVADALILMLVLVASWRFLQTAVVVNQDGIVYRAFHRTMRYPWDKVEAFAVGPSGITLGLEGGREVWLMPTKPMRLRNKRNVAEAERILQLMVARNPEPMPSVEGTET